jgi:predicted dehydrogenase
MTTEIQPNSGARNHEQGEDAAPARMDVAVWGASGANASHMLNGLRDRDGDLIAFDLRKPDEIAFGDAYAEFVDVGAPEALREVDRVLGSGTVHAVVASVVPALHVPIIEQSINYVGTTTDVLIVPKPVGRTPKEVRHIMAIAAPAEARLRQKGETHKPVGVHEHYLRKNEWEAAVAGLPQAKELLGQLSGIEVAIQEMKTIEEENRVAAVGGGVLEDLGPHVVSLILSALSTTYGEKDSQDAEKNRYTIGGSPVASASVDFLRYNTTELEPGKDTGFVTRTEVTVTDAQSERSHVISLEGSAGKGLVDQKHVKLHYTDPVTGEPTATITVGLGRGGTIEIDLADNMSHLEEAVSRLFPETSEDNGYYEASRKDMREGHQSLEDAYKVTQILFALGRKALSGRVYSYDIPEKQVDETQRAGVTLEQVLQAQ